MLGVKTKQTCILISLHFILTTATVYCTNYQQYKLKDMQFLFENCLHAYHPLYTYNTGCTLHIIVQLLFENLLFETRREL